MLEGEVAPPLLEREHELLRATRWLAAARGGHGGMHALEGPSGIGKTSLLDAIAGRATDFEILRAAGTPLERDFAFGLVRDLFEPWLAAAGAGTRADVLAGGAEQAASAFAPEPVSRMSDPQIGSSIRGLFHLTANLQRLRPVLIAVDDVHWADHESLRYLAYLGSRLRGLRALVVLAWRRGEPGSAPLGDLFRGIGDRIQLTGLSEPAIGELLEVFRPGSGRVAARCRAASGGNPWFVVELCRAIGSDGRLDAGISGAVPPTVASAVTLRIRALGEQPLALARAAAVLDGDGRIGLVAALAGLELDDAVRAADLLTRADVLAPTSPLAFAAPIVGAAVIESISPGQRAVLHGDAARLLTRAGAPRHSVARHLLLSEPAGDPSNVAVLGAVARDLAAAGDLRGSARHLRRALAEPPEPALRSALLLELGALESRCGLPKAEEHLLEVIGPSADIGTRARAALELADLWLLRGSDREASALLERVLAGLDADAGAGDLRALALHIRAEFASCQTAACGARPERWWGDETRGLSGATPGERALLAAAATGALLGAESRSVTLPLIERAARVDLDASAGGSALALLALLAGDHLELVEQYLDGEARAGRAKGSLVAEAVILTLRPAALVVRGALLAAETQARQALRVNRERGFLLLEALALASLIESLLDQGRLADAERELGEDAPLDVGRGGLSDCLLMITRGRLWAAGGDAHAGAGELLAAGAMLVRSASLTPGFDWRSRAGLISHRLGRQAEARSLIDGELALARKQGAPRALGVALRALALVSPSAHQLDLLDAAAETLRDTPARLGYARALCDLGSAHRRLGTRADARAPLEEGLQLAHECGALALAQRARHELVVLGARPRRHAVTGVEALTARERQAGELAADGLSNREIAAAMCVTANTVEYHLTNAYRKLGIATRERLRAALRVAGDGGPTAATVMVDFV